MKHNLLIAIAFAASFITLSAQNTQDTKADKIIYSYIEAFNKQQPVEMQLSCIITNSISKTEDSFNCSLLVDNNSYRLELNNMIIIDNGKETVNYNKEINEITLFTYEESENPILMILNHTEYFAATLLAEFNHLATINLLPKKEGTFSKAQIVLNTEKNTISSFWLSDDNANEYEYTVMKYSTGINAKDKFSFSPEQFPGATIIDMR